MSHEPQHFDTRRVAFAGAVLGAGLVVVLVVCFFLWRGWSSPAPQIVHRPPEPRLQDDPARDRAAFDRRQRNLDHWGWVDREHGIARIPVARAMELMVAHGRQPEAPR